MSNKYPPATDATPEELVRALMRPRPTTDGSPAGDREGSPRGEQMPKLEDLEALESDPSALQEAILARMDELGVTPEVLREIDRRGTPPGWQDLDRDA